MTTDDDDDDDDDVDGDNDDDDGGDDFPSICTKRSYVAGLKALALACMCPLVDFLIRRHMGLFCLSFTLLWEVFLPVLRFCTLIKN